MSQYNMKMREGETRKLKPSNLSPATAALPGEILRSLQTEAEDCFQSNYPYFQIGLFLFLRPHVENLPEITAHVSMTGKKNIHNSLR